jgi:hypothetical protein
MKQLWSARSVVCSRREPMEVPRVRKSFRHGKLVVTAVAQIIWSTLDDTSTYAPPTDPWMLTVMDLCTDLRAEADLICVTAPAASRRAIA